MTAGRADGAHMTCRWWPAPPDVPGQPRLPGPACAHGTRRRSPHGAAPAPAPAPRRSARPSPPLPRPPVAAPRSRGRWWGCRGPERRLPGPVQVGSGVGAAGWPSGAERNARRLGRALPAECVARGFCRTGARPCTPRGRLSASGEGGSPAAAGPVPGSARAGLVTAHPVRGRPRSAGSGAGRGWACGCAQALEQAWRVANLPQRWQVSEAEAARVSSEGGVRGVRWPAARGCPLWDLTVRLSADTGSLQVRRWGGLLCVSSLCSGLLVYVPVSILALKTSEVV